jgi:hypothetical protein
MDETDEMAVMARTERTDRTVEMELQGRMEKTETRVQLALKVKRVIQALKVFKA